MEFSKELDQVKAKQEQEQQNKSLDKETILQAQREKDLAEISKDEKFLNASKEVNARDMAVSLRQKANQIQNEELNRQWEEYLLKKKKEEQAYRTKLEKNILKQEIQAEINEKKRLIAERRYGYLYKREGESYKDFTQSKTINRLKEINNWYKGLTDNVQKAIKTTVKFIFKAGITLGALYLGYRVLIFLSNSGLNI